MDEMKQKAEGFRLKFEKFLNGCDTMEELSLWNTEELGEMEAYYTEDLACLILNLIAADGCVTDAEAKTMRELFEFDYTAEQLQTLLEEHSEPIREMTESGLHEGLRLLASMSDKMADAYRELLASACALVAESDGLNPEESDYMTKLLAL